MNRPDLVKSSNLNDDEVARRLARVYGLIIEAGREAENNEKAISECEFGDPNSLMAEDEPAQKPEPSRQL